MQSRPPLTQLLLALAIAALTASQAAALTPAGTPDDHFMCYKTKASKVSICADGSAGEGATCSADVDCGGVAGSCAKNKFAKTAVTLEDAFDTDGSIPHTAIKAQHLCAPADKNGEGVVDPATHLLGYRIKPGKGEAKHVPVTGLEVMNQFGLISLDTVKPDRLLVPAAKDLVGPVAEPDPSAHDVDHYRCYKVKIDKNAPKFTKLTGVSISEQFETADYDLIKPTRLCRAVDKNGEGIKSVIGHMLCYKPKLVAGQSKHTRRLEVYTNDQLGPSIVDTIKSDEFCVPSVVLDNTAGCDVLNGTECLLPWPSTGYMADDVSTDTGVRIDIPAAGLPDLPGSQLTVDPYNERDGFSPMAQILMHFPQGVDPEVSDASRLLAPGCCGQPAGPPWIDTRTHDDRSLHTDSPTLLFDADTGEQILHFVELDARAAGDPGRQSLVMRPGESLAANTRYIVAMRNLKTSTGDDVLPEAPFLALRDQIPTALADIEDRRQYFEDSIFAPLTGFGVDRSELVLAFDFITASEHQLTNQILTMRDEAHAWLATVEASPLTIPFTVDEVTENDCGVSGTTVWRLVKGTYQSPFFLDGAAVFEDASAQVMNVDASDSPVQNGFMNAPYTISVPCSVLDPLVLVSHPVVLGHGLFGTGEEFVEDIPSLAGGFTDWKYIAGATDWRGLSALDLAWLATQVIGISTSKLHQFESLADRLSQGMLNTLVLSRMMKLGLFNRDPAFQTAGSVGVFPGDSEEMYYFGASLGGIMGTWYAALTPDVERFGIDVPAVNFSCLLQRSTAFDPFESLLQGTGLIDPLDTILGLGMLHEIWSSAEPAGFARHITSDRLPGSGTSAARVLMTPGFHDKLVSNQCAEIGARTLGLPSLVGASIQSGLVGIPDMTGPLDSAYIMWDTGSFDLFNPAHQPFIPPLTNEIPDGKCDPHGQRARIPASVDQLVAFMQPGGVITNTCNGLCDGGDPSEIPNGNATPCDPLN